MSRVRLFRIQKSCAGTWESRAVLCFHWRGTFPLTSASTLTWTRKSALFTTFIFSENIINRTVTSLMTSDWLCMCILFLLCFRSGRFLLSGDTEGVVSVWDTHTVPPDGNEELLQPQLRFRAHWDCTNGIRYHSLTSPPRTTFLSPFCHCNRTGTPV